MQLPARGVAALGVARRFASTPIIRCRSAHLVEVRSNSRLSGHSTMRRAPAMPHSARSLPPRGRHSRLTVVRRGCKMNRLAKDSWRSHVHRTYIAQRVQSFKLQTRNVRGQGAEPLAFSWGSKGAILSRERMAPLLRAAPSALPLPPAPCAGNSLTRWTNQKSATFFEKPT